MGRSLLGLTSPPSSPRTDVLIWPFLISPNRSVAEMSVELAGLISWKLYSYKEASVAGTPVGMDVSITSHSMLIALSFTYGGFTVICKVY